ncbi:hypothetical protein D3C71_1549660 [compost metagenome]
MLPVLDHQVGPGVDHARGTDHEQPDQGHDAQQVVQVQPFDARRAFAAHGAEFELAHEGRVEHHAADDGHQQQHAHEAQEELARQAGKQVHMQLEHDPHEAFVEARLQRQQLGRARVDHHGAEVVGVGLGVRHGDVPDVVGLVGLGDELHAAVGILGARHVEHLVQARMRRAGGHGRGFDFGAQQVADLVVEDQRQAGQAQQQHENSADQAAPFVHPGPDLDGVALHWLLCVG